MEDLKSVCSCTAISCDPFHIKAKRQLRKSRRRDTLETEETLGTRCSTRMRWYSSESLGQKTPIPHRQSCELLQVRQQQKKASSEKPKKSHRKATEKAGSVHDLRRYAVSSMLKVPPQYTNFDNYQARLPLEVQPKPVKSEDTASAVTVIQSDTVVANGQVGTKNPFGKLIKLANCWTIFGNNAPPYDNDNVEFEEGLQLEVMSRSKRVSL